MVLADMGADVVKIAEPKLGDYLRAYPPGKGGMSGRFLAINRGKRSLALDLKAPPARDAFLKMVERADVVVESFRPGVMDKLGIGYAALAARNPKIIVCSISGYGQTGPYVERAGHDLNYIATAGVLGMTGPRGGAPQMPGVQIADLAGGGLWGATAILGALVGRDRNAKGAHLDISMTEGSLALLTAEFGNLFCGANPSRGTEILNGAAACYAVYRTKDERYLSVGAIEPKFWIALNQAVGRAPNVNEIIDPALQDKTRSELATIFATKTAAEWTAFFAERDCLVELVLEPHEVIDHPLHRAREVFFEIDGGEGVGPIRQVRTPIGTPAHASAPPRLGQQSQAVLREYGFTDEQITALLA